MYLLSTLSIIKTSRNRLATLISFYFGRYSLMKASLFMYNKNNK